MPAQFCKTALLILTIASAAHATEALIEDRTHDSQVLRETRHFRIFLPGDYGTSGKRYPVIYWFHGYSERYNQPVQGQKDRNYDTGICELIAPQTAVAPASQPGSLRQRQIQVLDRFVDLRRVLVTHGHAIHACVIEGELHCRLAVLTRGERAFSH